MARARVVTPDRWQELLALVAGVLVLGLIAAVVVPQALPVRPASGEAPVAASTAGGAGATADPGTGPAPAGSELPAPAPAATPEAVGGVLVMWVRGGLEPEVATAAGSLPGVEAVAFVRSGTLGMTGVRDAAGTAVEDLGDGRRIPVAVAAVDPAVWRTVVGPPPDAQPDVDALLPGTVALSQTSAQLRGIGVGGSIDLEGLPALRVVAVVDDDRARGAELLLHAADADRAGVRPTGSLVLRHGLPPGAEADALATSLGALAPDDTEARVVPGDRTGHRAPLVLSLTEVKARFGEFWYRPRPGERAVDIEPAFVNENIVAAEVPILGQVLCHRAIVADLRAALDEIVAAGLAASIDPGAYAGCFNARHISVDGDSLSHHSWGIAVDINVDLSLPGLGAVPPDAVIEAFGRHGFRWGGDFLQPDNHHFEWVGESATVRPVRSP